MEKDNDNSETSRSPLDAYDWEELRVRSLAPGGFGSARTEIWPWLLHATNKEQIPNTESKLDDSVTKGHPDERQIRLDSDRSFVLYPVGIEKQKDQLQEDLHNLLITLFRKRPKLSYFQGYHDIATVMFLTLPPEMQLVCIEHLSLHRVRDYMGATLEPVLGLLRVTKNLLQLADVEYANLLSQASSLPFYALSNLLTLFSHDMPTLHLIQHVFDYLLCRPPIVIVYLVAAALLCRKNEVLQLQDEGEGGMLHSVLSSLPEFTDELMQPNSPNIPDLNEDKTKFSPLKSESCALDLSKFQAEEPVVPEKNLGQEMDVALKVSSTASFAIVDHNHLPISNTPKRQRPTSTMIGTTTNPLLPTMTLTTFLTHADLLYEQFPPTLPELSLSSIMGPQSVVYTWSEKAEDLPPDNIAEAMVSVPELITYPYIEAEVENKGSSSKKRHISRRLRIRKITERQAMLAGAVMVLGVVMALYGTELQGKALYPGADTTEHLRILKKTGKWVSVIVMGAGAKIKGVWTS